eukprot:TRINITY_DN19078_c0_g1_i1.p1 TRINITY_DN19078_c0_g1~~TRINITY_DN19078_c0_g1_i1.p1  ORF type:complete len:386 (+),score=66.25 TRINITY_DN19078_c0_g1_i1:164-1321(+)
MKSTKILQCVGIYRRPLPSDLITFSSSKGKTIFKESLTAGGCEGYFDLAAQFHTQDEPAYCGLGSFTMVMNALNIDEADVRKRARHLTETSLDLHIPLESVRSKGITFDEFSCMASLNGAHVSDHRASSTTYEKFKSDIEVVTSRTGTTRKSLIATFSRKYLGQTGDGHFSPIAAYHKDRSLVLVLDVARFKYPPYWVRTDQMWEAMKLPDSETGNSRGYFMLSKYRNPSVSGVMKATISWELVRQMVLEKVPDSIRGARECVHVVEGILTAIEGNQLFKAAMLESHNEAAMTVDQKSAFSDLELEIESTELFKVVSTLPQISTWPSAAIATLVVSSWPVDTFLDDDVAVQLLPPTECRLFDDESGLMKSRLLLMSGMSCDCHNQ